MTCNPYACSGDGKKVRFGFWEKTLAYTFDKEGNTQSEPIALKNKQGPYNPTKQSLEPQQAAKCTAGTATPALLNIPKSKLSRPPSNNSGKSFQSATTKSSNTSTRGARRNSAQRNSRDPQQPAAMRAAGKSVPPRAARLNNTTTKGK